MKHINDIEVIIVSNHSSSNSVELVKWMTTTLQSIVKKQVRKTIDMFFGTLKDAPAFYLS